MDGKKTSWQMYIIMRRSSNKIIREQLGVFKTVERIMNKKYQKKNETRNRNPRKNL